MSPCKAFNTFRLDDGGGDSEYQLSSRLLMAFPHTAIGLTSHNMCCLLLPLAPALIPTQSLVMLPCVIMCSRQPHTLFQIPSLLSFDNKCLRSYSAFSTFIVGFWNYHNPYRKAFLHLIIMTNSSNNVISCSNLKLFTFAVSESAVFIIKRRKHIIILENKIIHFCMHSIIFKSEIIHKCNIKSSNLKD